MSTILRAISYALVPILVSGIISYIKNHEKPVQGRVTLSPFIAIIGIIDCAFFLIAAFCSLYSGEDTWVSVVFVIFALLGGAIIAAYLNCRIYYNDDGFVAKNFFGIKRRFTYDEVTGIKINNYEAFLYMGNRKVMVDSLSDGDDWFLIFVEKKYKKLHGGKRLPELKKAADIRKHERWDLFRGNIIEGGYFVFLYFLMTLIIGGTLALCAYKFYFAPPSVENCKEAQTAFVSYGARNNDLIVVADDGRTYTISLAKGNLDAKRISSLCTDKTPVSVYYTEGKDDQTNKAIYYINAIAAGDTYLLTFEETYAWYTDEMEPLIYIIGFFLALWFVFVAMSIIIGRHPEKFSPWIVNKLFKNRLRK